MGGEQSLMHLLGAAELVAELGARGLRVPAIRPGALVSCALAAQADRQHSQRHGQQTA